MLMLHRQIVYHLFQTIKIYQQMFKRNFSTGDKAKMLLDATGIATSELNVSKADLAKTLLPSWMYSGPSADEIVLEPIGGAHSDPQKAIAEVGKAIAANLKLLEEMSGEELKRQRYEKFRAMGTILIDPAAAKANAAPEKKNAPAKKSVSRKSAVKTAAVKSSETK